MEQILSLIIDDISNKQQIREQDGWLALAYFSHE